MADGAGQAGRPGVPAEPEARRAGRGRLRRSGLADQFSDLELDCYWFSAPGDQDLTGTIERFVDQVIQHADTDPVKHMRLAALQRSCPLLGAELMASWRAAGYPDELVSVMVERALSPRVLGGRAAREALVARGDDLAVQALLTDIVLLSEARTGADLGSFREELSGRRRAIGPRPG